MRTSYLNSFVLPPISLIAGYTSKAFVDFRNFGRSRVSIAQEHQRSRMTGKSCTRGESEVVQRITITTGAQQREGRSLLDSEHLRHELVGYGGKRKKDRCKCMYKGCEVRQLYEG